MTRELRDRRELEQLREIDGARVLAVDALVDLDELQRARADLEQIVVEVELPALERRITDRAQLLLDRGTRSAHGTAARRAQPRELGQLRGELAVLVSLLEQVALDLAARGLRDALHGHDLGHFEPRVLVDEPRDLRSERQQLIERTAMQDEDDELIDLGAGRPCAAHDDLAEIEAGCPLRDPLEVMG